MPVGALGRLYRDGERICRQGELAECMYIVQQGRAEVVAEEPEGEMRLSVMNVGDMFGELALITREPRIATVRSLGVSRVLTIDKKNFLKRVHEDPSMAFRVMESLAKRINDLNEKVIRLKLQTIRKKQEGDSSS